MIEETDGEATAKDLRWGFPIPPVAVLVLRRAIIALPLLLGVSFITFTVLYFSESDPVLLRLGDKARDPAIVEKVREEEGLNDPFIVQYGRVVGNIVLKGDFGRSWVSGEPVTAALMQRFPATLELTIFALLISTTIGLIAGVIAGLRRQSVFDYVASSGALLGVSIPAFWLGLLLVYYGAVKFGMFPMAGRLPIGAPALTPVTGMITIDAILNSRPDVALTALHHLVLPGLTIATISMALMTRMTRASMIEAASQDYVRTARAKGLGPTKAGWHIFRNALIPIVTVIGLQAGMLLSGAIITETIFSIEGIGKYLVEAILNRDGAAVQGAILLIAGMFIIINTMVDIIYLFLDPRIRAENFR